MNVCVFQLYAPLVSWGEIAVGGERRSAWWPSRSAVIGLIAAALGIPREEEEELVRLTASLSVAVCVKSPGTLLKDYHTVQSPKKERNVVYHTRKAEMDANPDKIGTILSSREYRCDAYALVAVCLDSDAWTLQQIEEALRRPKFHLYLGRKSNPPALPLAPQVIAAENLKEAFDRASFDWPLPVDMEPSNNWKTKVFDRYATGLLEESDKAYYFWEAGMNSGLSSLQRTTPYDEPLSRSRWQFKMREEYMAVVRSPDEKESTQDAEEKEDTTDVPQ